MFVKSKLKNDSTYFTHSTYLYVCLAFTSRIFSKISNRDKRYAYICYFYNVLCSCISTSILKVLPQSNLPLSNKKYLKFLMIKKIKNIAIKLRDSISSDFPYEYAILILILGLLLTGYIFLLVFL